jgi:hypothetical protein
MVSVVTAFALNMGIIDTRGLLKVSEGVVEGASYEAWIDSGYPAMEPVHCLTFQSAPRVCFVLVQNTIVYPFFTARNTEGSGTLSQTCECPRDEKNFACNFGEYFTLSLLFSKDNNYDIIYVGLKLQ